ncbi:Uncharacterised protein [Dermatophilus congolensis]|uniref:Uncharacterized protein n=1 Tax=Dermatophilus congolensis TaxID=1863 RepID=A0A239V7L9_9MICO|nr:hypothetical protein [Dermatophilus congolensis]SNV17334.1 Uncharacterised protein [Dermatophilus congolensis]
MNNRNYHGNADWETGPLPMQPAVHDPQAPIPYVHRCAGKDRFVRVLLVISLLLHVVTLAIIGFVAVTVLALAQQVSATLTGISNVTKNLQDTQKNLGDRLGKLGDSVPRATDLPTIPDVEPSDIPVIGKVCEIVGC